MLMVMLLIIMAVMISITLMMICTIIAKKSIMDREKMSPFECGFDPKSSARMPFSTQFFLIAVIFLIFDIEITIILPMIITILNSNIKMWFLTSSTFMIILLMGLYHEWNNGILEWTN